MRHLLILLLSGIAAPALAQQQSDAPPPATAPTSATCTPEHAAMGHCKLAPPPQPQQPTCTPEHAAMGHCTLPPQAPPAAPTCTPEHAAMGHCTLPAQGQTESDPHAGYQMETAPAPPKGPPPPEARTGPEHAADTAFDPADMAKSREELRRHHGDLPAYRFFVERAETRVREGRDGYLVDGQAWFGGDIDKIWFKGEVEGSWGEKLEHAEAHALWSHAIDPWVDLQAGVRYDAQPGPDRAHLVFGVQGLAPYWWEVDGAVFLSSKGEVTARAEAEYDLRITQKLILQPRAELDFSLQDIRELGIGAGLSQAALGARLRYQVSPLVAPYLGVEFERGFGDTRRFQKEEGDVPGSWNFLAGVRFWF
jgi:copper resistance protein B